MKCLLTSFLFFSYSVSCFANKKSTFIQKNDSLSYYSDLANNPKSNNSLADAYMFFKNEKDKSVIDKDTFSTVNYLRQIAIIEYELGDYYSSENSIVKALSYLTVNIDNDFSTKSKVGLYNQLGRIYMVLLDYSSALKYFNEGLKLAESEENINIIKNNKALVYIEQLKYELAEKEFYEVYQNSKNSKDLKQVSRALDNLGYVESKLNRPNAINKLNAALKIRIKINDQNGLYSSNKYLSKYYYDKKDYLKAEYYANEAYEIAKSLRSSSYIEDALENIITLSKDQKILEYKKVKDSIDNAKQLAENKYALVKFNYFEQEKIANNYRLENEKEKSTKILYQALGFLVFIISIFLYFILKSKHKKDKIQQAYITETRISKKVHDEVANDVYQVMTKLQEDSSIKENILDDLDNIYSRTRDISRENSALDVNDYFEITLNDLFLSYKNENINIITRNIPKIDWNTIEAFKKITLYRVLQELMVNMKKHSQATNVALTFNASNNRIGITYKDNGIGCKIKKGTGLLNMENRIKSIKGTIIFESEINKGFKAKIIV